MNKDSIKNKAAVIGHYQQGFFNAGIIKRKVPVRYCSVKDTTYVAFRNGDELLLVNLDLPLDRTLSAVKNILGRVDKTHNLLNKK